MSKEQNNLNFFSEKLTLELKNILALLFSIDANDLEVQEIGRHLAQFVFLKEVLVCPIFDAKQNPNNIRRAKWA